MPSQAPCPAVFLRNLQPSRRHPNAVPAHRKFSGVNALRLPSSYALTVDPVLAISSLFPLSALLTLLPFLMTIAYPCHSPTSPRR